MYACINWDWDWSLIDLSFTVWLPEYSILKTKQKSSLFVLIPVVFV